MTRHLVRLVFALALGVMGCSETAGTGGSGGGGGSGGWPECQGPEHCDDGNECTDDLCSEGMCSNPAAEDGTACGEGPGACEAGVCVGGVFACTEQGILDAISVGGGPHTFDCDGPTAVVTEAQIIIINDVILDGEGKLTVDGNDDHGVFFVARGVVAEVIRFTVTAGQAAPVDVGAVVGIHNEGTLTVRETNITENTGGGILNAGTMTVVDSVVSANTTGELPGGGILNVGRLTLLRSTVSRNNSTLHGGGGIANAGTGILTLVDSTVSGNLAARGGGGIINTTFGTSTVRTTTTLISSTVSANHTEDDIGGGIMGGGRSLTLFNCTVSGNTAGFHHEMSGIVGGYEGTIIAGSVVDGSCGGGNIASDGYNIESPGDTCGFDQPTDQVNVSGDDLKLGELADNGGLTMTHALGAGSVAIDQIPAVDCVDADGAPLTTDQRGERRPAGAESKCDIGSVEAQASN